MSCIVATVQDTETVYATSNSQQTLHPAVELSLGDDQEAIKTVDALPTSSNDNSLPRTKDDDGVLEDQWETTAAFPIHKDKEETYQELIDKVQIGGSPEFQKVIRDMLSEPQSSTLLLTPVASEAARVPTLTLKVNENEWRVPRNKGAARQQHADKHEFIRETVDSMLKLGVIETSQHPFYSQVHVAPKPHSKDFRFCIDYRALNQATESFDWPLPKIDEMPTRLAAKKYKIFSVADLTSGFHQTPLDEACRKYSIHHFNWSIPIY